MSELKPCPFCGNKIFETFIWKFKERVQCQNTDCPIHGFQMEVERWNTRSDAAEPKLEKLMDRIELAKLIEDYCIRNEFQIPHGLSFEIYDTYAVPARNVPSVPTVEEIGKKIDEYMPCRCIDAYKKRNMSAPDCANCNYKEDIAEAVHKLVKEKI